MGRRSVIDKLPREIREEINRLRVEEHHTVDEILAHLKTMGVTIDGRPIVRSTMGLHVKKLDEVTARIREARAVAEGIAPTLAKGDDGQLLNMNVELLHSAIMRIASAKDENGKDVQLTPSQAMAVGKALESSSKAQKINADRVLKIKKETATDAAKVVEKVLKMDAPGLSAETVAKIKRQVLGVAT